MARILGQISTSTPMTQPKGGRVLGTINQQPIAPAQPKAPEEGIFRMETLKGTPSYQASKGGFSTVLPNLAKTAGNLPSSAVNLARTTVIDPIINTVKVPIEATQLVREQGVKEAAKNFAMSFADTINKGPDIYKGIGQSIYNYLEKNVLEEDSVTKGLLKTGGEAVEKIAETAIEDPLLIPSLIYSPGKLKGFKGKDTITTIAEPFIKNPVVDKVSDLASEGKNLVSRAVATRNQAKVNNIIQKRADEIAKIEGNYSNTRKANQFSKDAGYSSRQRVASTDVLVDAVDENGLIRTKGEGGAVEQYRKMTIDKQEGVVRDLLQKEGASIDPKTLSTRLKSVIENDPLIKGDAKTQALAKVDKEIAAYKRTPDGKIPLTEIHDAKIATTKTIKDFATPAEYKTYQKSLARGLKETIEDSSTANVKQINAELSKYYDDISLLERLDGKRVKGGKLGKYFAQISGNIVGGAAGSAIGGPFGGAVGAVVGGELSSKVKGSLLSRVLGGRTGQVAPKSKILQEAVENVKKPLLGLPAPKKGAPQSVNVGGGVIPIAPQGSKMEFVGKDYSKSFGNRNTKYNTTNTPNMNANIPPSVPQPAERTFMDMLKSEKGSVSVPNPLYKDIKGIKLNDELRESIAKEIANYDNKPLTVRIGRYGRTTVDDFKDRRIIELQRKIQDKSLNDIEYKEAYELLKAKGIDAKPVDKVLPKKPTFKQNSTTGKLEGSIPATQSKLIQEAKKYKSAEEFVKAKTNALHGSDTEITEFSKNFLGKNTESKGAKDTFFFTSSKEMADEYGRGSFLKKKVGELGDITPEQRPQLLAEAKGKAKINEVLLDYENPKIITKRGLLKDNQVVKDIQKAKEQGYDAIIYKDVIDPVLGDSEKFIRGDITAVFDAKNIKTKSQLTDIWNKANKKSLQVLPKMPK